MNLYQLWLAPVSAKKSGATSSEAAGTKASRLFMCTGVLETKETKRLAWSAFNSTCNVFVHFVVFTCLARQQGVWFHTYARHNAAQSCKVRG